MCFNILTAKVLYFIYNNLKNEENINLEKLTEIKSFYLISLYDIKSLYYCTMWFFKFITEAQMLSNRKGHFSYQNWEI